MLKPTGSFWLNLGDTYNDKGLAGIPWRVALRLIDGNGWTLRNSVIWNKMKSGMDNSQDRLGSIHENAFHFVKKSKGYYYDADALRSQPRSARVENARSFHQLASPVCATANRLNHPLILAM